MSVQGYQRLTQRVCSPSVAASLSRIEFGLLSVHVESCCSTRILVKTSKSLNLLGSSSVPKGLRCGAFATNCRRVYSSKMSSLPSISASPWSEDTKSYVRPLCDETCFSNANPICASFSDACGFRHSLSSSCVHVSYAPSCIERGASQMELGANQDVPRCRSPCRS